MTTCKICKKDDFYASGRCKNCANVANRKFYAKNIDKERTRSLLYAKSNPEKGLARSLRWAATHKLEIKKAKADYYQRNKLKFYEWSSRWAKENFQEKRIHSQNRRSRKRSVGGKLSDGLIQKLYSLQRGRCACCKAVLGNDFHLDHRIPLALGGANTDDNMQLLKPTCNLQKHAQDPVDFMQSRGYLI